MTTEGIVNLANNVVVGFTEKRGNAWWNSRGMNGTDSQGRPNHFPGAVPLEVVQSQVFPWTAEKRSLYYAVPATMDENGVTPATFAEVPGRVAIVRSDTGDTLGVFKDGYMVHNYGEWLTDTIATILDDDLSIGSAGTLKGGRVGWVSVEVPENIVTPEGVEFRPNLFGVTSMDGTLATMFKRCVTNIVCDNTLRAAQGESGQEIKVKHSKYSGFRIAEAREALAVVHSASDDFAAEVAKLSGIKVNAKTFGKFLDTFSPLPEGDDASKRAVTMAEARRERLTEMWKTDPRVAPWGGGGRNTGSAWGVVQLVNTFDQHETSVKRGEMSDADKAGVRWERSILNAVDGTLDKRTDEVAALVTALAA